MKLQGVYKKDDCEITATELLYNTAYSVEFGSCLEVFISGAATGAGCIPAGQVDGFTVFIPLPENILTIGADGLDNYVMTQIEKYK